MALELDEFRESVDIDLLCPTIESYRAVRNTVLSNSLGELVNSEFNYLREISFDRYAVRAFINVDDTPIKIEVVSFDRYQLSGYYDDLFPIPYLDKESCFYTKLLANADRAKSPPYKDITDILFMVYHWGDIPESSLFNAKLIYGNVIETQLKEAVIDIQINKDKYLKELKKLSISEENISIILNDSVEKLSSYLSQIVK